MLRGLIESFFHIGYLLQDDHERRSLAYQYAAKKRELRQLQGAVSSLAEGKRIREVLNSDSFWKDVGAVLDNHKSGFEEGIRLLESQLSSHPLDQIESEWTARKTGKDGKLKNDDPPWHFLFSGYKSVRDVARKIGQESVYLFFYKNYSDYIHAGSGMDAVKKSTGNIRPLHYPGGLYNKILNCMNITLILANAIMHKLFPERVASFSKVVVEKIYPLRDSLKARLDRYPEWQ